MARPVQTDNADVETAIQSAGIKDDNWIQKLLEVDRDELIQIVSLIMNEGNIDNRSVKRVRTELESFSVAKWANFAVQAGLPESPSYLRPEYYGTPVYQLPPSFHKAVFENSWRVQDAYQEAVEQTGEESRILDPYIVPVLALFHGRVIDKPEEAIMPGTAFSTGGEVEHKIVMFNGILLFVIEARSNNPSNNNLAQLFLEFLSAAKMNKQDDFEGLRIYGILTNLTRFAFYSYDPIFNRFCRGDEFLVQTLRDGFSSDMIYITNKIFGVVLSAFIEGLCAIAKKTKERAAKGIFSSVISARAALAPKPHSAKGKQAQKGWDLALNFAEDSRKKFMENVTTSEDMEIRSTEALELLTKSVSSIPRYSAYTSMQRSDCLTPAELKDLACQCVESTLQASLS